MDKVALVSVCRVSGHCVTSLPVNGLMEPKNGMIIPQYKIICTRCGGNQDEISQETRARRSGGKRGVKENRVAVSSLGSPPPPISSQQEIDDL